jgi:hypothetical protein
MWRVLTLIAMLWPSHLSGALDGAPLDRVAEAVLLGLVVPALMWAHPAFLRKTLVRTAVIAILLIKAGAMIALQQSGWCVTFTPPSPMVRDSTGKPHSWDPRADWLSNDPRCSAIMTHSYQDTGQLPAWFYNLPPPDDAVVRGKYSPGEFPVRISAVGYLTARRQGSFDLLTAPSMDVALRVDGVPITAVEPAHHRLSLARGSHLIEIDGTLIGKQWRIVPQWEGLALGSMRFPIVTVASPSRIERALMTPASWAISILVALVIAGWSWSAVSRLRSPHLVVWTAAAATAIALVTIYLPRQAAWYTVLVTLLSLVMPIRRRFQTSIGIFVLLVVPWLTYVSIANAEQVGRWTLYGIGNDNFQFQRFAYRIFMQGYWLEGGQPTFWNQPFYRWIAGALHMLFGDSSVGQAYWDAAGVAIMMLFAFRVVSPLAGFTPGALAAMIPMAMFLLGPALEFVGFGLSEISSAAFIYLAAFFAMRNRGARDALIAGVLVALGFYTRLNNLPMAIAVAAFALPMTVTAGDWWRVTTWLPKVQWRVVAAVAAALIAASILFAWRTWYFTGVFSLFHGTQREYLAVWKAGMTWREGAAAMFSSVMMVLTGRDPARFALHATPLLAASVISVAAVCGLRGFRGAPLPVVAMFLAGVSSALVTRGWAYEGRFSIHLYGSAAALCVCWVVMAAHAVGKSRNIQSSPLPAIEMEARP